MKLGMAKTFRTVLLMIACIMFIAGLSLTKNHKNELAHNPEDIKIKVLRSTSTADSRYYYVDLDYKITNNTDVELYYVEVTAYFNDKNDELLGTINSKHGSQIGYAALKLEESKSTTQIIQLSARQSSSSFEVLFAELYNNGIEDMDITYEITYVKWSDGYEYRK